MCQSYFGPCWGGNALLLSSRSGHHGSNVIRHNQYAWRLLGYDRTTAIVSIPEARDDTLG